MYSAELGSYRKWAVAPLVRPMAKFAMLDMVAAVDVETPVAPSVMLMLLLLMRRRMLLLLMMMMRISEAIEGTRGPNYIDMLPSWRTRPAMLTG